MKIVELLEQAKTRANLPSDYALAKAIGVKTGHVSDWRKGKRHPSDDEAVQLATLAGMDEMQVIAAIHYETATSEKKKEFWKCYLESRGIAATACFVALGVSIMLTPEPAQANVLHLENYDAHQFALKKNGIYIMRISWQGTAERLAFTCLRLAVAPRPALAVPGHRESVSKSPCC